MRADMAKLIVERPRYGSRCKGRKKSYRKAYRRCLIEDAPTKESIYALRGGTRFFNEFLNPLVRYLHSQVGRPWNDVFSDICANIRLDSTVQKHVRDHVHEFVELHAVLINGVAHHSVSGRWWSRKRFVPIESYGDAKHSTGLYVCPKSGLLRRGPVRRRTREQASPPNLIHSEDGRSFERVDGIWYELFLRPWAEVLPDERDVNFKRTKLELDPGDLARHYGKAVIATRRRQLNSREIRRLTKDMPRKV